MSNTITPFIAYFRVSTAKQGASGLGLEAQRAAVVGFLRSRQGNVLAEFTEVESGSKADRPQLRNALEECERTGSTLLIAKLDRLGRSVAFVSALMESKTNFIAVDMPEANKLLLHVMAAVAEHERDAIRDRTRRALAAAKARGVKLGTNGAKLAEVQVKGANEFARLIEPHLRGARDGGAGTLKEIATWLNERGVSNRSGGSWLPMQISRCLKRLGHVGAAVECHGSENGACCRDGRSEDRFVGNADDLILLTPRTGEFGQRLD